VQEFCQGGAGHGGQPWGFINVHRNMEKAQSKVKARIDQFSGLIFEYILLPIGRGQKLEWLRYLIITSVHSLVHH
jgi:hypothetical protein